VLADEQYLRDALMLPNSEVVAGYRSIMPTYEKLVSPEQANQLIAYLQSGGPR
jgi:cytochrome c oxidase subunit 2